MSKSEIPDREASRRAAVQRCRERRVLIPTLAEQRDPGQLESALLEALRGVPMQDLDPLNLFRITWKNNVGDGGFGGVNHIEIPTAVTGVRARIVGLVGHRFPTGAHKVGAAFGCLVPRLVTGGFDPTRQRAVWPSTGNYCRGGAFDSALLGCRAVAILPEEMSQERFRWLADVGAEVIATPGCESNVKEVFDACWEIKRTRPQDVIFNQFEEFGNYLWHYGVTGPAAAEVARDQAPRRLAAWVVATGSAGTLAAGDHLKEVFPGCRVVATEALQCPTLLATGFGAHRIEGIGDKHVPWIHNSRNTDAVCAIDDEDTLRLARLFNEPAGHEYLASLGLDDAQLRSLPLLGLSSLCNLLACVKIARWFELSENDLLLTSFTDAADLYQSRLAEMRDALGPYDVATARVDHERRLLGQDVAHVRELTFPERKAIHNLKYFTWVEQQGRDIAELERLWSPSFWRDLADELPRWDEEIDRFNADTGVRDLLRGGAKEV